MEATGGFEPPNNGFADRCLTTWLRGPEKSNYILTNYEIFFKGLFLALSWILIFDCFFSSIIGNLSGGADFLN
jgi:hypothetical protein